MPERRRVTALSMSVAVAIVAQGVMPLDFLSQPQAFSWMPFRSSIRGSIEANYSALFEKSFWYFSLIWLLTRGGWRVGIAAFATASLLAAVEVAQMWMPGRTPDVTDPLIALVAGLLLAMPRERSGQAVAHDGGAAPRTAHERAS